MCSNSRPLTCGGSPTFRHAAQISSSANRPWVPVLGSAASVEAFRFLHRPAMACLARCLPAEPRCRAEGKHWQPTHWAHGNEFGATFKTAAVWLVRNSGELVTDKT